MGGLLEEQDVMPRGAGHRPDLPGTTWGPPQDVTGLRRDRADLAKAQIIILLPTFYFAFLKIIFCLFISFPTPLSTLVLFKF